MPDSILHLQQLSSYLEDWLLLWNIVNGIGSIPTFSKMVNNSSPLLLGMVSDLPQYGDMGTYGDLQYKWKWGSRAKSRESWCLPHDSCCFFRFFLKMPFLASIPLNNCLHGVRWLPILMLSVMFLFLPSVLVMVSYTSQGSSWQLCKEGSPFAMSL